MNTINISNEQLTDMCKKNDFNHSKLIRCHIEVKGLPMVFSNTDSFVETFKQLMRHCESNEIADVIKSFDKFKRQPNLFYTYDPVLMIFFPELNNSVIVGYMIDFMKSKNMKHDLIFEMQNENTYRYTTRYTTFNQPKPSNNEFYDCISEPNFSHQIPVNIMDKGFEETKGEEATMEAEKNEQRYTKNKWRIRRYDNKGSVIMETNVQFLNSLINDEKWPELKNKDTIHNIKNRPNKKLKKLNITIDKIIR